MESAHDLTVSLGTRFRLIVDEEGGGAWNMAVDEALLEAVGRPGAMPIVRLYGFVPPTLSVGRFQKSVDAVDFETLAADGVDFVRRPSGGQAVLHTGELTYAVLMGHEHLRPFGKRSVYRFIAPLLLAGLAELGVAGADVSSERRGQLSADCFASTGEYEIDSPEGRKLVGSAQMVTRAAVLQHGSIPISDAGRGISRYFRDAGRGAHEGDGHAGSIEHELGRSLSFDAVRRAYVRALGRLVPIERGELTSSERTRAAELEATKYAKDEWNRLY